MPDLPSLIKKTENDLLRAKHLRTTTDWMVAFAFLVFPITLFVAWYTHSPWNRNHNDGGLLGFIYFGLVFVTIFHHLRVGDLERHLELLQYLFTQSSGNTNSTP